MGTTGACGHYNYTRNEVGRAYRGRTARFGGVPSIPFLKYTEAAVFKQWSSGRFSETATEGALQLCRDGSSIETYS